MKTSALGETGIEVSAIGLGGEGILRTFNRMAYYRGKR
jgi:aryl-alcohol dehydrogenase-like predicted oxidoreductase